ncbi:hypothetical protein GE061_007054 [Apolygus lucorum]|uniref:Receptor expression-enhancing protein n=1 Tax=Apolygus lucorum TaxID=248454 RepID=A0A6A4JBD2_APOLU|nr:hypothetical protein GE061_007054 [Apolygus lucorum]
MITALVSRLIILAFGTLYPAYASYKAVRTKDVKEYVKWMMYWIVFALFTCAETFTDVLLSFWFPFYYEIKVALVFWLLSPATKGSSFLYRNFVHPAFQRRENEIDEMILKTKERGYNTVLSLGSKSVTYATNVILQTAMKTVAAANAQGTSYGLSDQPDGYDRADDESTDLSYNPVDDPNYEEELDSPGNGGVPIPRSVVSVVKGGGGLMEQLIKRSYSLTDLPQKPQTSSNYVQDIPDGGHRPTRPASRGRRVVGSTANLNMRFPEVDVDIRSPPTHHDVLGDIRSTEDISSGYSSTDQLFTEGVLTRSSSLSSARARGRGARTTQPRNRAPLSEDTEESEDEFESAMPIQTSHAYLPSFQNNHIPQNAMHRSLAEGERTKRLVDQALVYSSEPMVAPLIAEGKMAASSNESAPQFSVSETSQLTHSSYFVEKSQGGAEHQNCLGADTVERPHSQCSLSSEHSDSGDPERKGKYRKRLAPPPPVQLPSPVQPPTPVQAACLIKPLGLNFPDVFTD